MERLKGKRAVVTGGAQGIGAAIARRLASEGARVAVLDLNGEGAAALLPAPHIGLACDVADSVSVDRAFADIRAAMGGIDILVNNAGRGSAPGDGMDRYYAAQAEQAAGGKVFADQTLYCEDEGWDGVLNITLNGVFRCTRAAVRLMAAEGVGGSIINIASTSAANGVGPVPYCTAKAAVIGMTRAMARELADRGIRVNAINPGAVETPIYAGLPDELKQSLANESLLKRLAQPDEIGGAAAFLASEDASFATGSTITVNGGAYFI
ncbi:SDR family oxidoreductase [Sphingobium sp.]|uniref:SDR family NAD(P)-dependent oxidoreductase n=1 Tax=Sphingobium sp. TaxID=1912891 RepID=UPI0028BE8882|nr:SDR family oxidoreductase [Sphingobium sp.]